MDLLSQHIATSERAAREHELAVADQLGLHRQAGVGRPQRRWRPSWRRTRASTTPTAPALAPAPVT